MWREAIVRPMLRAGRFYRILKRVDAIPAGTYRFEGWCGGGFEFSVGSTREIRFKLKDIDGTLVVQVPYTRGCLCRTTAKDFLRELYDNIGNDVVVRMARGEAGHRRAA